MMKIKYIIPGAMSKTELGKEELKRRLGKLKNWASPGTIVEITDINSGPASVESMFEGYLTIKGTAEEVLKAEREGYDAVIIGCYGDPGLDGLREITNMLVIGPAGASMNMAIGLGHNFSIITVIDTLIGPIKKLALENGVFQNFNSIRAIGMPVIELNKSHDKGISQMIELGKRLVKEDKADVLVLGCMSMGFLDVAAEMMDELHVPVINPAQAGLKYTEALLSCGLTHSPIAYKTPPKIKNGLSVKDLFLQ
jgi:allantoin racemase